MDSVVIYNNLSLEDVILTTPKPNKNKGLSAAIINGKTKASLYMETPYCKTPFGASAYDPTNGADETKKSWSLTMMAVPGANESEENVKVFHELLKSIDEKMIDWGIEHSMLIFKKAYKPSQRGIVEALYKRCVKPSVGKDGTVYSDRFDFKIMKNELGLPDLQVFKDSATPLSLDSWDTLQQTILKGMPIKAIIQFRVFIIPGSFGLSLKSLQIKIPNVSRISKPVSYAFSEPPESLANEDRDDDVASEVVDSDEEESSSSSAKK